MQKVLKVCLFLFAGVALAQQATMPAAPATPAEVDFVRYVLMSIASPERDPQVAKMNEDAFVRVFGLNQQEASILHSAGESFAAVLRDFQSQRQAVLAGKASVSQQDISQVNAVTAAFNQAITVLANQVLNSVRPEKAMLLRLQGDLVGEATSRH